MSDQFTVIAPKRPRTKAWVQLPCPLKTEFDIEFWFHQETGIRVFSAVEVMKDEVPAKGPEYHLSMSREGNKRVLSLDAKWVLRQFDLEGAEEDNHVPHGIVRNFWRPVAEPLIGLECVCKAEEPIIREDKGDFIWRPTKDLD